MANPAVLTADDQARARDDRAAGHGIVLAGDRTAEFKRARTHSIVVRVLRWGCPLSAVGLAALYVTTMLDTAGYGKPATPPSISPTLAKDFAMDNPRYEGFTKDGGSYVVTAKTALPDFKNPTQVQLNGIVGEMLDARKSRTDFTAGHGLYDTKADQLDLTEGITVVTQSGMKAQLQIGAKGVSDALVAEVDGALEHHELIKIRVASEDRDAREAMIVELAERIGAAVVQKIGKIAVLYRPSKDKRQIVLPRG